MDAVATKGEFSIKINDKVIDLPAHVRHGIVFGDLFVVVLDTKYSMRNVFAFDETGKQVWQIEDPEFEAPGPGYVLVDVVENKLIAHCRGAYFYVDSKTGRIYDRYCEKSGRF